MRYEPKNKLGPERARLREQYKHLTISYSRHDRDKIFVYYRPPGGRAVRIEADPFKQPALFREQYERAVRGEPQAEGDKPASRGVAGTWNAAVADYLGTHKYTSKAANTQRLYRPFLDSLRAACGKQLMKQTEPWFLFKLHDAVVQKQGSTQANTFLSVLANVVHVGRLRGWVPANLDLLLGIEHQEVERNSYRPYTDVEVEQYRDKHGPDTMARKAFELAYLLALGNADLIRLAPCHIDDLGNVWIARQKTGTTQTSNINADPMLRQIIDSFDVPADGPVDTMGRSTVPFLRNQFGKPFEGSTFRKQWRRWATEAGLREDFKIHGARATMVTDMMDAGVANSDGMRRTGHLDERTYVRVYGKQASVTRAAGRAQAQVVAARARKGAKTSALRVVGA
jgi:hypothetical protein